MKISEKENLLKFYRHETPDHLPDLDAGFTRKNLGILERPEEGTVKWEHINPAYPIAGQDMDWFGVHYTYDEHTRASMPCKPYLLDDITQWHDKVKIPDADSWDWERAIKIDPPVSNEIRDKTALCINLRSGLFERFHSLMGMEEAFAALLMEPEESKELLKSIADYKCNVLKKIIYYYHPDIFRFHDDYGTQQSMQMSPDTWRNMIKPHIKRLVDICHNSGVYFELHSCGMMEQIVPDFVEIGVDSWQGMHINNVVELKKITGNKLNYHMSLNIPDYQVLDFAGKLTEDSLRKDVHDTLVSCSKGGCYFPMVYAIGPAWWGMSVIEDEVNRCRMEIRY